MRTCDPKRGQQILESAGQLFAKRRYHEVRMDDIAAHAGVAKGTVYRYYRDKEELYLALAIHGMQRLLEESKAKTSELDEPDQQLSAFITHVVRFYEQYPYFLELIQRIETSSSGASLQALSNMRGQFYHLVTDLITRIHHECQPLTRRPEWAGLALLGMIRGVLRFTAQPWPKQLPEWIYHQFMHGLRMPTFERDLEEEAVPEVRFLAAGRPEDEFAARLAGNRRAKIRTSQRDLISPQRNLGLLQDRVARFTDSR